MATLIIFIVLVVAFKRKIFFGLLKSVFSASRENGPLASDGHHVPEDQDISCRQYGHWHEGFDTPRFIPHDDPEEGYIVINGVTIQRDKADRYEDTI